jgi:hypothetical protein
MIDPVVQRLTRVLEDNDAREAIAFAHVRSLAQADPQPPVPVPVAVNPAPAIAILASEVKMRGSTIWLALAARSEVNGATATTIPDSRSRAPKASNAV